MMITCAGRKGYLHLQARCDSLDGKALSLLTIGRVFLRCATVEQPIVTVPFFVLKQGRFQEVDVTNSSSIRGSDVQYS